MRQLVDVDQRLAAGSISISTKRVVISGSWPRDRARR
jgi:hypothetical protein